MNLSRPFIERPIMTTLLMVAVLFVGIMAYRQMPISNLPNVSYPTINVNVNFPGTTPETMSHAVALPLEKQFMAIPGVKLVSSNSTLGNTNIALQFDINKSMTIAAQDVQAAITTATPQLPPSLPYAPTYRKVNPAELPIIYVNLTSKTIRLADLYTYANNLIGQRISMLQGVSQVTTFGSPLAIRIQVDPEQLVYHDISLAELALAIQLGNPNLSTGQLDGPIDAPNISVDGQLVTGAVWNELIVAYRNGTPLRIKDLGNALESFQNNKISVNYVKGKESQSSILIAVQKEPNGNTVGISDAIHDLLNSLQHELPADVNLSVFFDRSISIRDTIRDVNTTLFLALILVVVVIFLYLGSFSDTIIPAIVLPMSVIGTFAVMNAMNFTLDNLSLLALTLAVGFIVDDAIVVLENIVRWQEDGHNRYEASLEGSKQIGFTIVSMTLSLVAVFIPIIFMGGLIGLILSEFALTLTFVTIISGIISLTLTPMLCSRFLPRKQDPNHRESRLSATMKRINTRMQNKYRQLLGDVIDHRFVAILVWVACVVLTVILFYLLPVDFVPDEDVGFFIAYTQESEAGSSYRMKDNEAKVAEIIRAHPAVESLVTITSYAEYRKAQNLILLKPTDKRGSLRKIIRELNDELTKIPGIQAFIKNVPLIDLATGQESRGDYQYSMQSIYGDKVYPSAKKLMAKMMDDPLFEGINSDLEIDSPQINVAIQRDKASSLGITATDVENNFLFGYSGNYVSRIETAVDQYDIILELFPEKQRLAETFNQLWMRSSTSAMLIPLSATAKWTEGLGASSINHIDQFPSVTISFNLAPHVTLSQALKRIEEYRQELVDPEVNAEPVGAAQTFLESVKNSGFLLFLSLFAIYIILGMLYESFIHPLTILSTLPSATLGGLLILLILGLPLSMYSFLGIILLIGIVKKNGIMMVDFAIENIRLRGMQPKEAILDACMVRFRPIMMTTMAAIFGALPIALGFGANGEARQPLGLVIIAGLCLSQLITLFITPIIYLMMEEVNSKLPWK